MKKYYTVSTISKDIYKTTNYELAIIVYNNTNASYVELTKCEEYENGYYYRHTLKIKME